MCMLTLCIAPCKLSQFPMFQHGSHVQPDVMNEEFGGFWAEYE